MISLLYSPLAPNERRRLQEFTTCADSFLFRRHLADRAAALTAQAGNTLVGNDPPERRDGEARELANQARVVAACIKLMDEIATTNYQGAEVILKALPVATTTTARELV